MKTRDSYELIRNLGLVQRQAGVDVEVRELVCAYARLKADAGRPIEFFNDQADSEKLKKLPVLRHIIENNPDIDPRFLQFLAAYSRTMGGHRFPTIWSVSHFAYRQKKSEKYIRWMAFHQAKFYRHFEIPKASGAPRPIAAPEGDLRRVQKWIQRKILNKAKIHPYATAYAKGRSVLDNVRPHIGRKVVIRMDIKDFFPSITHRQVRKVFEQCGYPYRVAVLLANLCTLDGRLPQGAPTSPALSNRVCMRMDRRFAGLAKKLKFKYSRYADDLVFSSDDETLSELVPFFKDIIREEGFEPNEKKIVVMRNHRRQKVTGIILNERPNLSRKERRLLRAAAHRIRMGAPETVSLTSRGGRKTGGMEVFEGRLAYLRMINGNGAERIASLARRESGYV